MTLTLSDRAGFLDLYLLQIWLLLWSSQFSIPFRIWHGKSHCQSSVCLAKKDHTVFLHSRISHNEQILRSLSFCRVCLFSSKIHCACLFFMRFMKSKSQCLSWYAIPWQKTHYIYLSCIFHDSFLNPLCMHVFHRYFMTSQYLCYMYFRASEIHCFCQPVMLSCGSQRTYW